MPVYSISRTSQYTTVTALETKTNQDGFSWNGFDLDGYHNFFVVTRTTVCPVANQTWNYSVPATPTAVYVWYPYSITLTVSGGNPNGNGERPGIAYLKLYDSAGTYLMGSYTTNALETAGASSILVSSGPSVQATTFTISNSRNTITLTAASTTFGAGFAAPSTATAFWNIFARTTGQTSQTVYTSSFSSTANAGTGNISGQSITHASQSMMGFITYNAGPVKPTNLVITQTTNGISITCRGNEAQSLSSGTTIGAVSQVMFFYSTTLGGTYAVLGTDTSITRTLISGTTYQYTAEITGTLNLGEIYYFKVATKNDVSIQYQVDNAGSVAASEQSDAVQASYGNLIYRRTVANVWGSSTVQVRGGGLWNNNATIKKRNVANTEWI
jgi:hypothetical protein